ncbi:MAG: hypothetical protein EA351_11700 [Gemmatimonadales bacterium]|nr:MAG: hypothetical protein EA351_11700 [Gemmatimonadales bacterium]
MRTRSLRTALLGGVLHGVALLPPVPGVPTGLDGAVRALLILGGLALVARALLRAPRRVDAARAGFLMGAAFSVVALHWVPSAAEPWFGPAGGILAGLVVWSSHAVLAALVFALMARARGGLPFPVVFGAGWLLVEWLPTALPLLHLPRPELASAFVSTPSLLAPAALVGGTATMAIWAAGAAALAMLVGSAGADRTPAEARRAEKWAGGAWLGVLTIVVLTADLGLRAGSGGVGAGGTAADTAARTSPEPGEMILVQMPLSREALSDPELRRTEITRGVQVGPADLWPESVLPDARIRPSGVGARPPVVGARWEEGGIRFNALVRIDVDGLAELAHRKRWLVPVIERSRLVRPGGEGGGLAPGAIPEPFDHAGRRVGALICFEFLFPRGVAELRRRGATLLLHVGNDAMLTGGGRIPFLRGTPLLQQERMLRLRAFEYGLPVVRSSLGGPAGAWTARGKALPLTPVPGSGRERVRVGLPALGSPTPATHLARLSAPLAGVLLGIAWLRVWRRSPERNGGPGSGVPERG